MLEPLSLGEAIPDLVDAAAPDGVGVWIRLAKETLETGVGGGGEGRSVCGRGCEPAGAACGVVVGARWWERESHIEQEVRTVAGASPQAGGVVRVSVRHEAIEGRLPTHVARAVHDVPLGQRRRRSSKISHLFPLSLRRRLSRTMGLPHPPPRPQHAPRLPFPHVAYPPRSPHPHPQASPLPAGSLPCTPRLSFLVRVLRRTALAQAQLHPSLHPCKDDARPHPRRPDLHIRSFHPPSQLSLPRRRPHRRPLLSPRPVRSARTSHPCQLPRHLR